MRTGVKILLGILVVLVIAGVAAAWWAAQPTPADDYVAPVSVEDRAVTQGFADLLAPAGITDFDWAPLDGDGIAIRYVLPAAAEGDPAMSDELQRFVLAAVLSATNGTANRAVAWQQAGDADIVWTLEAVDWAAYRAGEIDEATLDGRIEKGTTPP